MILLDELPRHRVLEVEVVTTLSLADLTRAAGWALYVLAGTGPERVAVERVRTAPVRPRRERR